MKAEAIEKADKLNLTDIGGLFYAKRLKEKHHELLRKLKQQYGKPKKSVKIARKAWKDEGENFSEELLRIRIEKRTRGRLKPHNLRRF